MPSAPPAGDAYALILAGGGGTRLWPASRRSRPKQFLQLGGEESLLEATFRRAAAVFGVERTLVVTAADQAASVRAALPPLPPDNVVAEPAARNTAAAVGLGAAAVARRAGESAVLAVLPSDHHIGDERAFGDVLAAAIEGARAGIVTIGIKPSHPETGYGYLEIGAPAGGRLFEVAAFVEKPDEATARRYVESGAYLWNSGMFFFTAGRLLAEARAHLPALGQLLDALVRAADFEAEAARIYPAAPSISIDYGIMEKTSGIRLVPGDFGWNDVGSWAALSAMRARDAAGNVTSGAVLAVDTRGSVVVSEPGAPLAGVVGLDDVVVVVTPDAVLVAAKDRAQDVRKIVEALRVRGRDDLL
jgi:mannose-1-phosphate guanylyltransferase